MSSERDPPRLTEYLLGALPEEEAARLDEASVTDEDFALALAEAENDLVDAYVRGELPETDRERFESRYLSSDRRRDKVLFARALRDRLEPEKALPTETPTSAPPGTWKAEPGTRHEIPAWTLAAVAVLLLAPAGYLLIANGRLREELSSAQARRVSLESAAEELKHEAARQRAAAALALSAAPSQEAIGKLRILPLLVLPERRGISSPPAVTLAPDTDAVALQLRLEPGDESPTYQVTVKGPGDGNVLWKSGTLAPVSGKTGKLVIASVPASLLSSGNLSVDLFALAEGKPPELLASYSFRVTR